MGFNVYRAILLALEAKWQPPTGPASSNGKWDRSRYTKKLMVIQISIFLLIVRDKKNFHSLEMDLKIEGDKVRALEAKLKQQTASASQMGKLKSFSPH